METNIGVNKHRTVGLLISTYNWPEALDLVFQSILNQSVLPDEIIIADDGSGRQTRELVAKFASTCNIPIKHTWHENHGFRKSLILNKAMQYASADYIIEIDGDIIMHPRFIEDHCRCAEVNAFVQGSRVMVRQPVSAALQTSRRARIFSFISRGISNRFNALRIPAIAFRLNRCKQVAANIKACNLAFWRRDFILVNGYNNEFEGWGCEDAEFVARLLNAGLKKKRLKFAAICYHLYHQLNSKYNVIRNEEIYATTLKGNATLCKNGYLQVQQQSVAAPVSSPVIEVQLPNPSIAS